MLQKLTCPSLLKNNFLFDLKIAVKTADCFKTPVSNSLRGCLNLFADRLHVHCTYTGNDGHCVRVMVDGERKHLQKQLVLCNLKEAYSSFKEKFPGAKIGFSKFAELRPKQCVLAGSSGTHSVCTTHQNMKLMFAASKIDQLTSGRDLPQKTVQDCSYNVIRQLLAAVWESVSYVKRKKSYD